MTETAMTPQAAVAEIRRLENLRGPLERRTSGITWMIWGIATSAIFMSYNFLGLLLEYVDDGLWYFMPFAWLPWVAMGILATRALWKSANIVMPNVGDKREGLVIGLVFLVLSWVGYMLTGLVGGGLVEPAIFLAVVGIVSVFFGSTGIFCRDGLERMLQGVGGALLILVALVPSMLLKTPDQAYAFFSGVAPFSTAAVYFVIGITLTLRS